MIHFATSILMFQQNIYKTWNWFNNWSNFNINVTKNWNWFNNWRYLLCIMERVCNLCSCGLLGGACSNIAWSHWGAKNPSYMVF